jgi:PTS system galactitol-specific IIB component
MIENFTKRPKIFLTCVPLKIIFRRKEVDTPKRILVACGTAIATSTVVARGIEEALKDRGIQIITRQCKAAEVRSLASDADLIVTTTPVPSDLGVPSFRHWHS